jgi:uncharacterized damage-inducible protein DinB
MDLEPLLTYSTNAQTRLYEFLLQHPESIEKEFDTIAQFKTIRRQLAHVTGAEQRWTTRIVGTYPPATRYEDIAPKDIQSIYNDWKSLRAETHSALATCTDLNRVLEIKLGTGEPPFPLTIEQILIHVVNHENFHRGQCSMMLQLQHIDPPYFDFIFEYMGR